MKIKRIRNLGVLCTIIGILLANTCVASAKPEQKPHNNSLFNLQFVMNIRWGNETDTPISPGELREVNLTISYTVVRGALGRMILLLLEGSAFPLRLTIGDKPDWCSAQLAQEQFMGVIKNDQIQCLSSILFIQLSEEAPHNYTLGYVKIHGVIDDMKGPFNILTLINGYEQESIVSFVTGP